MDGRRVVATQLTGVATADGVLVFIKARPTRPGNTTRSEIKTIVFLKNGNAYATPLTADELLEKLQ